MAILDDLPTSSVAEIVRGLNPRLYIDFVQYLPAEICLKILAYLDPNSLLNVARACRSWYDLALDWKLWQRLYLMEGWKAVMSEIQAAELAANSNTELVRRWTEESRWAVHALQTPTRLPRRAQQDHDADHDFEMVDAPRVAESRDEITHDSMSGAASPPRSTYGSHPMQDVMSEGKGKGIATHGQETAGAASGPAVGRRIPRQTLLNWDANNRWFKMNWKYLYTMRHKLESNWELGKYVNFQLPRPDHPEEGHVECIYTIQFNNEYLVSGSRDRTLRIWNLATKRLVRPPLRAHLGSVLCLQFDADPEEDIIVSGSSDSDVILWRFSTGELMQRLRKAHRESVLNVKFDKRILVTCSKDKTIKIFNRQPLRKGDLGYEKAAAVWAGVAPVASHSLNRFGFNPSPVDELDITIPPYHMIGALEGHGAAVNAVQICGREIVSASGDRHIKVWDWPQGICSRTFIGHNKGIACVQYDGRRIVSGSSDNEVKVFDRETGLEVASLHGHSSLVRTVQAGFGDLPYSREEDAATAREVDRNYFRAVEAGELSMRPTARARAANPGSSRPQDITAYGARLPPGGGGGKYGRIVSGSYDQTIIIWRRKRDGVWHPAHTLRQEEGAAAASRQTRRSTTDIVPLAAIIGPHAVGLNPPPPMSLHPTVRPDTMSHDADRHHDRTTPSPHVFGTVSAGPSAGTTQRAAPSSSSAMSAAGTTAGQSSRQQHQHQQHVDTQTLTPDAVAYFTTLIDQVVPQGPQALAQALSENPSMLALQTNIHAAIDRESGAERRTQLRQILSAMAVHAQVQRSQLLQARAQHTESMAGPSSGPSVGSDGAANAQSAYATPQGNARTLDGTASGASASFAQQEQQQGQQQPGQAQSSAQPPVTPAAQTSSPTALPHMPPTPHPHHHQQQEADHHGQANHNVPPPSIQLVPTVPANTPQLTIAQHAAAAANLQQQPQQPQANAGGAAGATGAAGGGTGQQQQQQQQIPQHVPQQLQQAALHQAVAAHQAAQQQGVAVANVEQAARVFKLQFDARRIVCCSQSPVIVGWDFCNGNPELEQVSRFFGTVE